MVEEPERAPFINCVPLTVNRSELRPKRSASESQPMVEPSSTANDLSAATTCDTQIDGPFSATHGLSALNISATNLQADSIAGAFDLVSATDGVSALNISATNLSVNTSLSAAAGCTTVLDGAVSAALGISIGADQGLSAVDAAGKIFFFRRQDGATYENLIRATDGTITLQTEDDIHFKSNTGEDFARFNENAAVWLYHDNSRRLITDSAGVGVSGTLTASALKAGDMPIPAPFGYMALSADDALSVDEKKLGYSNTPTTIVTDGITWDDTNKYFVATDAGTYEIVGVVILEGGSTLVNLSIQKNGSDVLVGQPRVHSTVDPLEHTIRAVFTMTAGQNANITYDATASNSVKAITGSTMTIKRLM